MKLQEYQAKQLLAKYGVPIPEGFVCDTPEQVAEAVGMLGGRGVVKAQVLAGGRGKAGGVKVARSAEEAQEFAASILGKKLYFEQAKSELPIERLYVEEALPIAREYYIGITTDRATQRNVFIVSSQGGMDIEEVAHSTPDAIGRLPVDPFLGVRDFAIRAVATAGGIPASELPQLAPFLKQLYTAYVDSDANLAEINPLIVTADGKFIAGDAKITIDDNALFRHPEFVSFAETSEETDEYEKEARRRGINNYVHLDGNIGIICNGAGLTMGTMDEVKRAGGQPADFLDIGGGAKAELVKNSLELVLSDPNVKGVLINIFGGITRGDEVARGILEGTASLNITVPIIVRLAGTNAEEGLALLRDSDLIPAATMQEAAQKIVSLVGND
ncbi:MAG: ADP-forming succinate--CoA ligase subunit beta [Capsulimonadales bacterium]|nr:ADP-forming succinate--CoA ligase subunit beta [Capsulimonadales bacterium]